LAAFAAIAAAARTPVSSIMSRDVVCIPLDSDVEAMAQFFFEHDIHAAPVLDEEGELVGFVSWGDLLRRARSGDRVRDVMTPIAITLSESSSLTMAAALMAFEGVQRIPIVSTTGDVVGILSALDVMRWLAREDGYALPDYTQLQRRQSWTSRSS
jgi:CBS-domain-containing membrane protein